MLNPETDALASHLDRVLSEHVAKGVIGASLALIRPGGEVLTLAAGCADRATGAPLTPDHLFKTASTRKTWTAVAVLALVSEGRIDLDQTIEGWFPHLPRADEIRVRHLLSHRSGLPEYESFIPKGSADDWTPGRIVEFALANGTQIAPGEAFVYSNPGYVLAGEIVASERGEPLSRWLRREVFGAERDGRDLERRGRRLSRGTAWRAPTSSIPPSPAPRRRIRRTGSRFPVSGLRAISSRLPATSRGGSMRFSPGRCWILPPSPCCRARFCLPGSLAPASPTARTASWSSRFGDLTIVGHLGQLRGHVTMAGHHEASGLTAVLSQNSCSSDLEAFGAASIHPAYAEVFRLADA